MPSSMFGSAVLSRFHDVKKAAVFRTARQALPADKLIGPLRRSRAA